MITHEILYDCMAIIAMLRLAYILCCDYLFPIVEKVNRKGKTDYVSSKELEGDLMVFMVTFVVVFTPITIAVIIFVKVLNVLF